MSGRKPAVVKAEGMRILSMTEAERRSAGLPTTMDGLAQLLEVHPSIPYVWKKELENFRENYGTDDKTVQKEKQRIKKRTLTEEQQAVYMVLYDQAMGGNVTAARLLYEKWGFLVKKEEITHKFDGGDIARAVLEAEYELGRPGESQGMGKVQEKPTLLLDKLHSSPGQDKASEGEIPDMASPPGTN